jgi:hypothetical protein
MVDLGTLGIRFGGIDPNAAITSGSFEAAITSAVARGVRPLRKTTSVLMRLPGVVKVTTSPMRRATRPLASDALPCKGAPLGQRDRASLLVNPPGDEIPLLIEMIVDLGVN